MKRFYMVEKTTRSDDGNEVRLTRWQETEGLNRIAGIIHELRRDGFYVTNRTGEFYDKTFWYEMRNREGDTISIVVSVFERQPLTMYRIMLDDEQFPGLYNLKDASKISGELGWRFPYCVITTSPVD